MITLQSLIKHAEAAAALAEPPTDNIKALEREHRGDWNDRRSTLSGLFDNLNAASKSTGSDVHRLFPKADPELSSPLLKTASAAYVELLRRGFLDELEKLAIAPIRASYISRAAAGGGSSAIPAASKAAIHTAFGDARAATGAAAARPTLAHTAYQDAAPKVVPAGVPNHLQNFGQPSGLSPAVQRMREQQAKPGFFSRMFGN